MEEARGTRMKFKWKRARERAYHDEVEVKAVEAWLQHLALDIAAVHLALHEYLRRRQGREGMEERERQKRLGGCAFEPWIE